MKRNRLREIWASGGHILNGWLHIPSTWSAEVMAHAGWDSLTVDLQHGMHGIQTAIQMLQAISTTETVPLVRVNWHDPGTVMRVLDAGAYGVICPMVNTQAECEAFVGACRYPPQGYRSLGPTRARLVMGADYADHANAEVLAIAMVETREALDNLDAIAAVDGLDMLFVGTGDLQLSLTGRATSDGADAAVEAALDRVLAACARHHRLSGLFTTSTEDAVRAIKRGFRFVAVKSDSMILGEYARQLVQQTRQHTE